jgi:Cytochrome C'
MFKVILPVILMSALCFGADNMPMEKMDMEQTSDTRQSLGIKGTMQGEHQLNNMREHLKAVSDIIRLTNNAKFDEASKVAKEKLGLSVNMNTMCGSFNNKTFEATGVAFHKSADELATALKTKDYKKSMKSLEKVMNGCIACHSAFKQ